MRRQGNGGSRSYGPIHGRYRSPSNSAEIVDETRGWCPAGRFDEFFDFLGGTTPYDENVPLYWNDTTPGINSILTTDTKVARYYFRAKHSGKLTSAVGVFEDALATSDTNYVTFAVTNRRAGAGSTAMLASSAAGVNTTKATGGTAIAAKTPYTLTVNATAANVAVTKGDIIEVTATVAGTLANVVDGPLIDLTFDIIPPPLKGRIVRTAGAPYVQPVANGANGLITAQLDATSEAQTAGADFGDQLPIVANKAPFVEWLVNFTALPVANQRWVCGLASAFNATLDSVVTNAWFRLEGASGALEIEGDDGTTDTDDQAANDGVVLVVSTDYRFGVDMRDLAAVKFYLDDRLMGTVSMPLAATAGLQPVCYFQKASGTGTGGFNADYLRIQGDRK